MKKTLIALTLAGLLLPQTSEAQKIRVKRVKGNSAVVEFTGNLQPGKTYGVFADETNTGSSSFSNKQYLIAGSAEISARRDGSGVSDNRIAIDVRAGWNKLDYEFGPLFSFSSVSYISNSQTFSAGGWYDYNMIANTPGEIFIYGVSGLAAFGMTENDANVKQDLIRANVGLFMKWFPQGTNVGFRFDGGYDYEQTSGSNSGTDYSQSGLKLSAGFMGYF